jgi:hypothetical protein
MLLGGDVLGEERVPLALTLLFASEGGLRRVLKLMGAWRPNRVNRMAAKVNGSGPRYRGHIEVKAGGRSSPPNIFKAEKRA